MTKRKFLRTPGGILASAAVLCAGSALVAASLSANPGSAAKTVKAPMTEVPAGDYVGVCPDPAHLLEGAVTGADAQFSPESTTAASTISAVVLNDASSAVPPSSLSVLGKADPLVELAGPRPKKQEKKQAEQDPEASAGSSAGVVESTGVDAPSVLTAEPLGQQQAAASALMTYSSDDGDLEGLAASTCQQPDSNLWIVGANTTLGQTALLNIANPSGSPARVDLSLYGGEGEIEAAGSRSIVVPAGGTESVILGGLAPEENRLAVQLRSSGAPITANIQQSALRDLTPGGVEYLSPAADPSTRQVVTGVRIQDEEQAARIADQPGYASTQPVLQVAVPGSNKAVARVRVFGPDGKEALDDDGLLTVPGGSVQEVRLDSLPEGTYTIEVSADVSIAAAARMGKGTKPSKPVDMGYTASTERMGTRHVIPVPGDAASRLVFGAPAGDAEVELTPLNAEGETGKSTTIEIAGGTTRQMWVSDVGDGKPAGFIAAASGDAVYGAQLLTSGNSDISAVSVPGAVAAPQELPVMLGY